MLVIIIIIFEFVLFTKPVSLALCIDVVYRRCVETLCRDVV